MTAYELWYNKRDERSKNIDDNEFMAWGRALEEPIAHKFAEDNGWEVRPKKEFIRLPELRIGSSFDFEITNAEKPTILEIKNVGGIQHKAKWADEEAPPHIELQVQHQLFVAGYERAYIAALIGGNKSVLLEREIDMDVVASIQNRASKFWSSVDCNNPPEPDYSRDSEFMIKSLYNKAGGPPVDADGEIDGLVRRYKELQTSNKALTKEMSAIKARIVERSGTASKILGPDYTISLSEVQGTMVPASMRKGYRRFSVRFKGGA